VSGCTANPDVPRVHERAYAGEFRPDAPLDLRLPVTADVAAGG